VAMGNLWQLRPRLPVYPHHDDWLPEQLRSQVAQWRRRLSTAAAGSII
jgi:hypothetical protein